MKTHCDSCGLSLVNSVERWQQVEAEYGSCQNPAFWDAIYPECCSDDEARETARYFKGGWIAQHQADEDQEGIDRLTWDRGW